MNKPFIYTQKVFPAPAGINRLVRADVLDQGGVPRASGDKPRQATFTGRLSACSPRQRG
ncbi:hypothetical protein CRA18_001254 [Escherichia coli]|nr:hypothetical protein [Escherichia coli]